MKKALSILLSTVLCIGAYSPIAFSENILPVCTDSTDEEVTFIIEVDGDPALIAAQTRTAYSLKKAEDAVLEKQAAVMSAIQEEILPAAEKEFVYTSLFNGFSLDGNISQLEELKNLPGVKNVYISETIPAPEPDVAFAGDLTGLSYSYDTAGYSGEGQVIAVIDIYCDTRHDFFSTAPENPKYTKAEIDNLIKTHTLNSGVPSANQVYVSEKVPYAYNYITGSADTFSQTTVHGTHVSGIAAGKNGTLPDGNSFSGVAPESQLMFLSAGTEKGLPTDAILAALNDAAFLGADVINMSFGSNYEDSSIDTVYEEIAATAKKAGISLISSAGNEARGFNSETPLTTNIDYSATGEPTGVSDITAVASAENTSRFNNYWSAQLPDETEIKLYSAFKSSDFAGLFTDGECIEYVDCGYGTKEDFTGKDVSDKIALIKRGDITFLQKAANADEAGAAGIILRNTDNSVISIVELSLPTAMVTKDIGNILAEASDKSISYIGEKLEFAELPAAGKLSSFSSWGVDSTLELKPEITAPGGNIYSSVPDNKYAYSSGTSMSSPHMAGITALAREYYSTNPFIDSYNNLSGAEKVNLIENLAMNSANIIRDDNDIAFSPRVQGAGMVNMENLINSKVILTGNSGKAKVSLGELSDNTFNVSFDITNISSGTVVFDDINIELTTDGYIEDDGKYYVGEAVPVNYKKVTMPETVTINSGKTYSFNAAVELDEVFLEENKEIFESGFFIDGFVTLGTVDESMNASLPFTGFYGDWYNIPIFDKTAYDEGGSTLIDPEYPYITGTHLRAYTDNNLFYYIGRNNFDHTIADKKYISFSSQGGLTFSYVFNYYRSVSPHTLSIWDENENRVFEISSTTAYNKFYNYNFILDKNAFSSLEEGNYTFRVDASAFGSSSINDTLTLPLVIDNTPPEIIDASYDTENNEVTVYAKDNHYISGVIIIYYLSDGTRKTKNAAITEDDYSDGIAIKTVSLEDDISADKIYIDCVDYAINETVTHLSLYDGNIGASVYSLKQGEDSATAKVLFRNNTDKAITADLILALYNADGTLISASVNEDALLSAKTEAYLSYKLTSDIRNVKSLKIFVWEPDSQKPIDKSKMIGL